MARTPSRSYLTPHLLRRLLRRRETIRYPAGPLELPEAYQGQVAVEIVACVGCGVCERICPASALQVERTEGGGVRVVLLHDRCATCGLCAQECPRQAIRMIPSFAPSATSRSQLRTEWRREARPRSDQESSSE